MSTPALPRDSGAFVRAGLGSSAPVRAQVSPPEFALSHVAPSRMVGWRIVAVAVLAGDDGVLLGPVPPSRSPTTSASTCSQVLESSAATGATGEVDRAPRRTRRRPGQLRRLRRVLLVGVGEQRPDRPAPRGRDPGPCDPRPRERGHVGLRRRWGRRAGGLRRGRHARLLRASRWRTGTPEHVPVGRVVLAGLPDAEDRSARAAPGRGRRPVPAGGRGCSRPCPPTSRPPPGWPSRRASWPASCRARRHRAGTRSSWPSGASAASSAVGQASATPPRLCGSTTSAREAPRRRTRHVVLVGKGITFDTGGLSIKPGESMVTMKRDMTGAAVVIAVMAALHDGRLPGARHRPAAVAENAVSGSVHAPRRRDHATTAGAPPRSPTPTPRAGSSSPTGWPTPWTSSSPPRWSTSRPSPAASRSPSASTSAASSPTTTDSLAAVARRGRRGRGRAAVAHPVERRGLRGQAVARRSPTPTTPPAGPARSRPRCSSSTSSATPVGPPRHRLGR